MSPPRPPRSRVPHSMNARASCLRFVTGDGPGFRASYGIRGCRVDPGVHEILAHPFVCYAPAASTHSSLPRQSAVNRTNPTSANTRASSAAYKGSSAKLARCATRRAPDDGFPGIEVALKHLDRRIKHQPAACRHPTQRRPVRHRTLAVSAPPQRPAHCVHRSLPASPLAS